MAFEESSGYCRQCGERVAVRRRRFGVVGHAILCVLTVGLWLPVAALAWLATPMAWRCSRCGARAQRRWLA